MEMEMEMEMKLKLKRRPKPQPKRTLKLKRPPRRPKRIQSEEKPLIANCVARDDVPNGAIKKHLRHIFPCDERMIIILDDRVDVWPQSVTNVLQIEKYEFWSAEDHRHHYNPNHTHKSRNLMSKLGYIHIKLAHAMHWPAVELQRIQYKMRMFLSTTLSALKVYMTEIQFKWTEIKIICLRCPTFDQMARFKRAIAKKTAKVDPVGLSQKKKKKRRRKGSNPNINYDYILNGTGTDSEDEHDDKQTENANANAKDTDANENKNTNKNTNTNTKKTENVEAKADSADMDNEEDDDDYLTRIPKKKQKFANFKPEIPRPSARASARASASANTSANGKQTDSGGGGGGAHAGKFYLRCLKNCEIDYNFDLAELKRRDNDNVLKYLSPIFLKIHRQFYAKHEKYVQHDNKNNENKNNENSGENHNDGNHHNNNNNNSDVHPNQEKTPELSPDSVQALQQRMSEQTPPMPADARRILMGIKKGLLRGCVVVFANIHSKHIDVRKTYEWRVAREFGAHCVTQLTKGNPEQITHCLCRDLTSSTAINALTYDSIQVLTLKWLYTCKSHYVRPEYSQFRPAFYRARKAKFANLNMDVDKSLVATDDGAGVGDADADADVDMDMNGDVKENQISAEHENKPTRASDPGTVVNSAVAIPLPPPSPASSSKSKSAGKIKLFKQDNKVAVERAIELLQTRPKKSCIFGGGGARTTQSRKRKFNDMMADANENEKQSNANSNGNFIQMAANSNSNSCSNANANANANAMEIQNPVTAIATKKRKLMNGCIGSGSGSGGSDHGSDVGDRRRRRRRVSFKKVIAEKAYFESESEAVDSDVEASANHTNSLHARRMTFELGKLDGLSPLRYETNEEWQQKQRYGHLQSGKLGKHLRKSQRRQKRRRQKTRLLPFQENGKNVDFVQTQLASLSDLMADVIQAELVLEATQPKLINKDTGIEQIQKDEKETEKDNGDQKIANDSDTDTDTDTDTDSDSSDADENDNESDDDTDTTANSGNPKTTAVPPEPEMDDILQQEFLDETSIDLATTSATIIDNDFSFDFASIEHSRAQNARKERQTQSTQQQQQRQGQRDSKSKTISKKQRRRNAVVDNRHIEHEHRHNKYNNDNRHTPNPKPKPKPKPNPKLNHNRSEDDFDFDLDLQTGNVDEKDDGSSNANANTTADININVNIDSNANANTLLHHRNGDTINDDSSDDGLQDLLSMFDEEMDALC